MSDTNFVHQEALKYNIHRSSIVHKYIERKTKASNRDSKARRSLGNLYAMYVLCEDFIAGNKKGSSFTELMRRMKEMPFGSKLQNHPLDNRLNDEVRRQYAVSGNMLPVQPADIGNGKKARKISTMLLSENNMDALDAASFVVSSINRYIEIINNNQTSYLNEIEAVRTDSEAVALIEKGFNYNSDARLFEIISFALLHLHFKQKQVTMIFDDEKHTYNLLLYRTGRTNANDGGIDFVLKPLGNFFQVTETLDFKKYFLDFDKVNRYSMSFVIKTELTTQQVREQIEKNAKNELSKEVVEKYLQLFDDIFTINELRDILGWVSSSHIRISELKAIIVNCFKLEYGILD